MIELDIRGISSDCTEYGTVTTDCVTVGSFITEVCGKYPDSELTFRTEEGRETTFKGESNVEVKDCAFLDSVTWAGCYGRYTFIIKTKQKPKTAKKSGWVNIYSDGSDRYCGYIWDTDVDAEFENRGPNYIATVKIEWEEARNER